MTSAPDPETAPPAEPAGAVAALFGDRAPLARRFADHLRSTAVTRGLIGPREVPRLWERHILNCASICDLLAPSSTAVDVGSGAGLPGIAVAVARQDVRVTLLEPLQRRVEWLEEVVADLALPNVDVVRGRAEELIGTVCADVAMARAVAGLPVLAGWCLPLVRPGGRLLAVKGRTAEAELADSLAGLRALGATGWEVTHCGVGVLREPTTVVVVTAGPVGPAGSSGGRGRARGRRDERAAGSKRLPHSRGRRPRR
jgi:16S rRNA (guanine527-N7)-methyltransferase